MSGPRIALVLGASGGIGGETALALSGHGWKIRAFSRTGRPGDSSGWEWVQGDSLDRASVMRAAQGVSAIVHAVNPPWLSRLGQARFAMIENTLAAAQASNARILLPGTIYNYGPDAFPVLPEDSPQNATSHKGVSRCRICQLNAKDAEALISAVSRGVQNRPDGAIQRGCKRVEAFATFLILKASAPRKTGAKQVENAWPVAVA